MWLRKRRVFLSYSNYKSKEADLLEIFFEQNEVHIIRDKNVEYSYLGFMDKIEECDGVIFMLNNSFFESVYCTYEMIIWANSKVRAVRIDMSSLDIKRQEVEKEKYNDFIDKIYMLSEDQRRKIESVISDYNEYRKIVNKLLNLKSYEWNDVNFEFICNDVFKKILQKKPKNTHIKNAYETLENHLCELENIKDETLQKAFFGFLADLVRCSSFIMSPYDEDDLGEEKFRLKDYHIDYGQIGASIRFEVVDAQNIYRKIEIYDIIGIERNKSDFGPKYIKYYFEIRDRHLHRDYINQTRMHRSLQNKDIIDKYLHSGISRQRCTLYFQDGNALAPSLCDHIVVASYVDK